MTVIARSEGDDRALGIALDGLDGMVTALNGGGHEDVAVVREAVEDLEQRLRGAVSLVRSLYDLWGEDRIVEQMGTETLERFRAVLGGR